MKLEIRGMKEDIYANQVKLSKLIEDTLPKFQEEFYTFRDKITVDVDDLYSRLKTVASFDQLKDEVKSMEVKIAQAIKNAERDLFMTKTECRADFKRLFD